jgi:hypothetical protein
MSEPNPAVHLCECGCGLPTKIATEVDTRYGSIVGMPRRFRLGHAENRRGRHLEAGQRFSRGVILAPEIRVPLPNGKTQRGARLACDCGTEYVASISALVAGDSKSCGCLRRPANPNVTGANGLSRHPLYKIWEGVLARCENAKSTSYRYYGAQGIEVCERWHDVRLFIEDILREIGARPEGKYVSGRPLWTLDRTVNDGNYEPGNVRWATRAQQEQNKRPASAELRAKRKDWWARREPRTFICEQCGGQFQTRASRPVVHFCSQRCADEAAKGSGRRRPRVPRKGKPKLLPPQACHVCGSTFATYNTLTRHCSRSCGATCRWAGGCPR